MWLLAATEEKIADHALKRQITQALDKLTFDKLDGSKLKKGELGGNSTVCRERDEKVKINIC